MLVIIDGLAAGLEVERAKVIVLRQNEGFPEVASMLRNGEVKVEGFKIVILVASRADMWESDAVFFKSVSECL